jgi:hypothetical protein
MDKLSQEVKNVHVYAKQQEQFALSCHTNRRQQVHLWPCSTVCPLLPTKTQGWEPIRTDGNLALMFSTNLVSEAA